MQIVIKVKEKLLNQKYLVKLLTGGVIFVVVLMVSTRALKIAIKLQ